jgi:hypothetical protein
MQSKRLPDPDLIRAVVDRKSERSPNGALAATSERAFQNARLFL